MISFNCSVSGDKKFLCDYTVEMQIMPNTKKVMTESMIKEFPIVEQERIACVHVSYITRPFNEKFLAPTWQQLNLANYIQLANRIGFKYLLVHGPESINEWKLFYGTIDVLKQIVKKVNSANKLNKCKAEIIIEMPSFKSGFIDYLKTEISLTCNKDIKNISAVDYISYYFDCITKNGFEIVLDTAHLFANGCNVDQMITLFEKYKSNMHICHLNGNKSVQFHPDNHCPIFVEKNNIKDYPKLMEYLSKTDLILVAENGSDGVEYTDWEKFAKQFNLKIVPFNERLNC